VFGSLNRNRNTDVTIGIVNIESSLTRVEVNSKAGAFAGDVDVVCTSDQTGVQWVFLQFEKLTCKLGLEFNADKRNKHVRNLVLQHGEKGEYIREN
jgi:hypothetical protein